MIFLTIVLDGVGIGEQPDAAAYGDRGSDTLGHVLVSENPELPELERLGLGSIRLLPPLYPAVNPPTGFGKMTEKSAGKDSTTGHWELAGLVLDDPFPTYPSGFPSDVVSSFCDATQTLGVLGNRPESGTVIIEEFGAEHLDSGKPIVYTSADSVFQIATHVDVVPLDTLYSWCEIARNQICVGNHAVGRVIARPFEGSPGAFIRLSSKRKDFSRLPHKTTLQEALQDNGIRTVSVGKVADLFGGIGFDESNKTNGNPDGIERMLEAVERAKISGLSTFIWTNLIDFDQEFGHRNNPSGFARSLEEFDRAIPDILSALPPGSRMVITADHGNDPTTPGSDHTREYVPLLYYGAGALGPLGTRSSFSDHAATVASFFGVEFENGGTSFEPARR